MGRVQHYPLEIRPSRIHGKGIFAKKDIPSGAIIYESEEYAATSSPIYGSIQHAATEHWLEDTLRWENHSCSPNTSLRFVGPTIQLLATKKIRSEDELVCDYRTTEDSIPTPFRCNCGHCGGIIIG